MRLYGCLLTDKLADALESVRNQANQMKARAR